MCQQHIIPSGLNKVSISLLFLYPSLNNWLYSNRIEDRNALMNVLFNHDFWRLENQFQYITHLKIISQCICISYFLSYEVKQNRFVNYDSTTVSYTCRNNIFYAFCLQKQNNFCWFFKSSLL